MHRALAVLPGADSALTFLEEAYRTRLSRPGRTVEHPVAVAELLADDDQAPTVVIAGLLHDVLEDTEVTYDELGGIFGGEVADLVAALTQKDSIEPYRKRKAELRRRILSAGPQAATISIADKLAKLCAQDSRPAGRKLDHYRRTLAGVEERYGTSRLTEGLREQLDRWQES